jgi:hypothetical protein
MAEDSRGVLIVRLGAHEDAEETKRRVLEIDGVLGVDFNHLTRKLLVRYRGDSVGVRKVESAVKKVLEAERHGDREQQRRTQGKKRR